MCSVWARLLFFGRYLPHRVFPDSRLDGFEGVLEPSEKVTKRIVSINVLFITLVTNRMPYHLA